MLAPVMDFPAALPLAVPLPLPTAGSASRVRLGSAELVLEHARGAYSLLWSDGRESRRYVLGLSSSGRLVVELRSPRLPLQLVPRETLTVVPSARVRGYVTIPLVPTLVWRANGRPGEALVELLPRTLQGVWSEAAGHAFACAVTWLSRFPVPTGEPRVVVPLRLANRGHSVVCPEHVRLELRDEDLVPARGTVLVRPRRVLLGEGFEPDALDFGREGT